MSRLGFIYRCSYFVPLFVLPDMKELRRGGEIFFSSLVPLFSYLNL